MTSEEKIRKELQETLSRDSSNYGKILELSSRLASFDKEFVRFSVDAGVIDRLGKELVARQETAVSELVKNSYDADAKSVSITFENSDRPGGTLTIEDNGTGMSREDIVQGFMRISSTSKVHFPESNIYKRKRAGKKGIGRFAVQRLGEALEILTKTKADKKGLRLVIDWKDYLADTNLLSISNSIEPVNIEKSSGTILIIRGLRDSWSEASIKRIYRYIAAIIQPYPLSKEYKAEEASRKKKNHDPGFSVTLNRRSGKKSEVVADESSMIFKYAAAIVEGYVDKNGQGIFSVESKKLDINKVEKIGRHEGGEPFAHLRNVQFKAYYYIYLYDLIPAQQMTYIKELSEEIGGIRLYNNGFRVLPYGEPFFDWLRLDASVRKRDFLFPHGNNNFFGFVEVHEDSNLLEETSSREGLQENEAFQELQNFVYRSLLAAAREVASARGVKERASQKNWDKKKEKPRERILNFTKRIIEEAEKFEKQLKKLPEYSDKTKKALGVEDDFLSSRLKEFAGEIKDAISEQHSDEESLLKEVGMLRILASLGLTIGEFTHEIRHYLVTLKAKIKLIKKLVASDEKLLKQFEQLSKNIKMLEAYSAYFDRAISDNVTRDLKPQEINDVINSFVNVVTPDTERGGVDMIDPEITGVDLYTTSMHPSEWASVLFNLYTNSKKAIKRAGTKGRIFIKAGKANDKIFLEFSDNGDGIPEKNEEKIFDAFFTTSSPVGHFENDSEDLVGSGLGLKIVKDILSSYEGEIKLVNPPGDYETCFRIEVPIATKDEMNSI